MYSEEYIPTPQAAIDEANANCHYPCIVLRDSRTAVDNANLNGLCNRILVEFTKNLQRNANFSRRLYMTLYEYGSRCPLRFSDCQVNGLQLDALTNNHPAGYTGAAEAIQWLCGQRAQLQKNGCPSLVVWIGKDIHTLLHSPDLSGSMKQALANLSRMCEKNRVWLVVFDVCSKHLRTPPKDTSCAAQMFFSFDSDTDVPVRMQEACAGIIRGYQYALTQTPLEALQNYDLD